MQAIAEVRRATQYDSIDVMIVYGHGAAGVQGVTMGKDGRGAKEMAAITVDTLDDPALQNELQMLAPNFTANGVIVLHGCNVAEGDEGLGLLKKLAKVTGLPVKGSDWFQIVGRSDLAGNILTATPTGTVTEDSKTGLRNLGGLPPDEGLLLLGVEFGDRLLRRFRRK